MVSASFALVKADDSPSLPSLPRLLRQFPPKNTAMTRRNGLTALHVPTSNNEVDGMKKGGWGDYTALHHVQDMLQNLASRRKAWNHTGLGYSRLGYKLLAEKKSPRVPPTKGNRGAGPSGKKIVTFC